MQQRQWRYRCLGIVWALLFAWAGFFGCSDSKGPVTPEVLIQINDSVVTVDDFERAVQDTTDDFPTERTWMRGYWLIFGYVS